MPEYFNYPPGGGEPMPWSFMDFNRSFTWVQDPNQSIWAQVPGYGSYKVPSYEQFLGMGIPWSWLGTVASVPEGGKLWKDLGGDIPEFGVAEQEWIAQNSYVPPGGANPTQLPDPATWGDTRNKFDFFMSEAGDAYARDYRDGTWYTMDPQTFLSLGVPLEWMHGMSNEFVSKYNLDQKPAISDNWEQTGLRAYGSGYGGPYSLEMYQEQAAKTPPPWENNPEWVNETEQSQNNPFSAMFPDNPEMAALMFAMMGGGSGGDALGAWQSQAGNEPWGYTVASGLYEPASGTYPGADPYAAPGTYTPPPPGSVPPPPWTYTNPTGAYAQQAYPEIPSFEGVAEADLLAYLEQINALLPYYEAQRASGQWAQEFEESARRYESEMGMRAALESWQQGMAGAEFGLQEDQQARLWAQLMGYDAEGEQTLEAALAQAQLTGNWDDNPTLARLTEERLQAQMEQQWALQWAELTGQVGAAPTIPGSTTPGGEPPGGMIGGGPTPTTGTPGTQTLAAQQLEQQAKQWADQYGLSQDTEARLLAAMQAQTSGWYMDPVFGYQQTWEQQSQTAQLQQQASQWADQYGLSQDQEQRLLASLEAQLTGQYQGVDTLEARQYQQQVGLQAGELTGMYEGQATQAARQWADQYGLSQEQEARLRDALSAQMTGVYEGMDTLAARQYQQEMGLRAGELTGMYEGSPTFQASQWGQQLTEQQRQFDEQQRRLQTQLMGYDPSGAYTWEATQWGQELGQRESELGWQQSWLPEQQQTQIGWEQQRQASDIAWARERQAADIEAQKEIAMLSQLGRGMRPNPRWL